MPPRQFENFVWKPGLTCNIIRLLFFLVTWPVVDSSKTHFSVAGSAWPFGKATSHLPGWPFQLKISSLICRPFLAQGLDQLQALGLCRPLPCPHPTKKNNYTEVFFFFNFHRIISKKHTYGVDFGPLCLSGLPRFVGFAAL